MGEVLRLLVSDDEPLIIQALTRQLRRLGIEVIADPDSRVVELAREHRPAAIVLDAQQRVPGLELLARLRADPALAGVPVVVVSGAESESDQAKALALGAVDWVLKPFEPHFARRLAELCEKARRPES